MALEIHHAGLLSPDHFRVGSSRTGEMLIYQVGALTPPQTESPVPMPVAEDTDLWDIY